MILLAIFIAGIATIIYALTHIGVTAGDWAFCGILIVLWIMYFTRRGYESK